MESDTLFHCQICPYTICHSCYQRHSITLSSKQLDTLFIIPKGYHFQTCYPLHFQLYTNIAKIYLPITVCTHSKSTSNMRYTKLYIHSNKSNALSAGLYQLKWPLHTMECHIKWPSVDNDVHNLYSKKDDGASCAISNLNKH